MPITPIGQSYVATRQEFEQLAVEASDPSMPIGSDLWYKHGNYQSANQGGEHGGYGWRHPDLVKTEADQRTIISRNAAMPDKYLGPPDAIRGLGDWLYPVPGNPDIRFPGDLGRPYGWKWGDEPATALDNGLASNMDGSHCRYGPLFEIMRADAPGFDLTARIPLWGFTATMSTRNWATLLIMMGVRTFAGQLRHPYLASDTNSALNEPDRHNVLVLDFLRQAAELRLVGGPDWDAMLHHAGKTILAFQQGTGAHGEPRPEVGGLWAFQSLDCMCYAPYLLYRASNFTGIDPTLRATIQSIVAKRSVAHVQAWTPGDPYPYWIGATNTPSAPMDQLQGVKTSYDPLVPHGYEPWAYSSYRVGQELGVDGCKERAAWIAEHWKQDDHARSRYLVEPDGSLLFP